MGLFDKGCTMDCSARDAAIAAAQAALDAAIALQNQIIEEQKKVDTLTKAYAGTVSTLQDAGTSIASPANLDGLNSSMDCLNNYAGELSSAAAECQTEVSRCQQELSKAQARPCDCI